MEKKAGIKPGIGTLLTTTALIKSVMDLEEKMKEFELTNIETSIELRRELRALRRRVEMLEDMVKIARREEE